MYLCIYVIYMYVCLYAFVYMYVYKNLALNMYFGFVRVLQALAKYKLTLDDPKKFEIMMHARYGFLVLWVKEIC